MPRPVRIRRTQRLGEPKSAISPLPQRAPFPVGRLPVSWTRRRRDGGCLHAPGSMAGPSRSGNIPIPLRGRARGVLSEFSYALKESAAEKATKRRGLRKRPCRFTFDVVGRRGGVSFGGSGRLVYGGKECPGGGSPEESATGGFTDDSAGGGLVPFVGRFRLPQTRHRTFPSIQPRFSPRFSAPPSGSFAGFSAGFPWSTPPLASRGR